MQLSESKVQLLRLRLIPLAEKWAKCKTIACKTLEVPINCSSMATSCKQTLVGST